MDNWESVKAKSLILAKALECCLVDDTEVKAEQERIIADLRKAIADHDNNRITREEYNRIIIKLHNDTVSMTNSYANESFEN